MRTILRRVGRLEDRHGAAGKPQKSLRLIVALPWKGPANLATSTCRRSLGSGLLMELVELDGDDASLGEEELEQFVQSFPIVISGGERAA